MKKKGKFKKKIILFVFIVVLIILIGLFAFKKFYHTKISLPIDTPQEAIEIVKQNRVLIEEDLRLNGFKINKLGPTYQDGLYGTAYSVLVYEIGIDSSCQSFVYVDIDKSSGKIKYIDYTGCWSEPMKSKNFKFISKHKPPEEIYSISFCYNLSNQSFKDKCYSEYIEIINNSENINLCPEITDSYFRDECYIFQSRFIDSTDSGFKICENVSEEDRNRCYFQMHYKINNDTRICEELNLAGQVHYCFEDVAKITKNISICDKIYNGSFKDSSGNIIDGEVEKQQCIKTLIS